MLTLEQAIDDLMDASRTIAEVAESESDEANRINAQNFADDCKQIAELLRELQERRKQPEIIKCKDCAYYDWDCVDAPYGMTKTICWCDLHYDAGNENLVVNPDDYCKWAERRTE